MDKERKMKYKTPKQLDQEIDEEGGLIEVYNSLVGSARELWEEIVQCEYAKYLRLMDAISKREGEEEKRR